MRRVEPALHCAQRPADAGAQRGAPSLSISGRERLGRVRRGGARGRRRDELRRGDREVVLERPPAHTPPREQTQADVEQSRRHARDQPLHAQEPVELPARARRRRRRSAAAPRPSRAGPRARRAARARRRGRSTAPCGCPRRSSAGSGRRSRRRRTRRPRRRAQLVRDPVALVADGSTPTSSASRTVGSLTWKRGSNEPDADAQLLVGREAPAVAGGHVASGRSTAPGPRAAADGMDLQPARQARLGRLDVVAGAEHAAPAEAVDDQRRAQVAAVGVHDVARPPVHLGGLERPRPAPARAAARTACGSRRSRTSRAAASARCRGACARAARRRSAGARPPGPGRAATPVGMPQAEVWRSPIS